MNAPILAVAPGGPADVLLAEPALRSLSEDGSVSLLVDSSGRAAAEVTPAVARTVVHDLPWLSCGRTHVDVASLHRLIASIRALAPRRAVVFTRRDQSALPTALLLRLAGVPFVAARSIEQSGPLLDVRLSHDPPQHDVERHLELVEALGLAPFDRRLRVRSGEVPVDVPRGAVVVHPGGNGTTEFWRDVVRILAAEGHPIVLTGLRSDDGVATLRDDVGITVDLVDATSWPSLAAVFQSASVVCAGSLAPIQLAAAVGTPVVVRSPPVACLQRWQPWMVPHVTLPPCLAHDRVGLSVADAVAHLTAREIVAA